MLWGASRTEGPAVWGWLLVAGLSSLALKRMRILSWGEFQEPLDLRFEEGLRDWLLLPAPDGFAGQVKARLEPSVDLDEELVAPAPAGFRQRLLERLQSQEETDD